ncbi:MAG: class I tRNA ligase family protein, partial [Candidatus Cloacimonetes bacterium]|nr:class I tRNA ligase family protein [Candidatus Cloacimonadota bacterium]
PFDTVLLHGIVRDSIGRKMSKSLGNSPDPIDIINNVGADALRFSIIFNTPKGQDSYYSDEILETGRNFCNKIWNAFRFIMMNIENIKGLPTKDNLQLDLADKWIYSRLHQVTDEVNDYYQNLRFNDAAQALMQFVWDDFCSWYLEMAKEKFYNDKQESTLLTTKYVLLDVMQSSMRLLHPIMPFITEEVWQIIKTIYPMNEKALIIANFPIADKSLINDEINYSMNLIQKTITAIRNLRKQVNIPLGKDVNVTLKVTDNKQIKLYLDYQGYISKLAKVNELIVDINIEKPDSSLVSVVEDVQIFLPLSGLVDLEAEKKKLKKQKEKLEKELLIIQNKLKNEKFISNAKPEVIEKERDKENEVSTKLTTINEVIQGL